MNLKTNLLSAFAALFLSTVALGTTVAPGAVAQSAPATAALNA